MIALGWFSSRYHRCGQSGPSRHHQRFAFGWKRLTRYGRWLIELASFAAGYVGMSSAKRSCGEGVYLDWIGYASEAFDQNTGVVIDPS